MRSLTIFLHTITVFLLTQGCAHQFSQRNLPMDGLTLENIENKISQVQTGDFGQLLTELALAENYLSQAQGLYERFKDHNHPEEIPQSHLVNSYSAANYALIHRNKAEQALEKLVANTSQPSLSLQGKFSHYESRLNYLESLHIKEGEIIPLTNIYFDFGSSLFSRKEVSKIVKLIDFLQKSPVFALKLVGYADTIGSESYNIGLAKKRNLAVLRELQRQGLPLNTVITIAVGETQGQW